MKQSARALFVFCFFVAGVVNPAVSPAASGTGIELAPVGNPLEEMASEPGLIRGTITAEGSGRPLQNVFVTLSQGGKKTYSKTDANGEFKAEVAAGSYNIEMRVTGFEAGFAMGVRVDPGMEVASSFVMYKTATEGTSSLEEVVVKGTYSGGGEADARWSESVVDVLSAEDWSVTGDSNAVDALARVVGLTVVGGRYVYVRGLGERYSSTTLNGASIPTPDPTRRVVPLDMFPTGVLESVNISKTYAPNLPGDFSGGTVQLNTRRIPNEPITSISMSVSDNSQNDGGMFLEGGDSDWLGRDDGYRDLPQDITDLTDGGNVRVSRLDDPELLVVSQAIRNDWPVRERDYPLGPSGNIAVSRRFDGDNQSLGFLFGGAFENSWAQRTETRRTSFLQRDDLGVADESTLDLSENTIDMSGLLQFDWEIGNDHILRSTSLITRRTDKRTLDQQGFLFENEFYFDRMVFEWVERELWSQQFAGTHYFGGNWQVDWHYSLSEATRDEPDTRTLRYDRIGDAPYRLQFLISDSNERSWEFLQDRSTDWGFDADYSFEFGDSGTGNLKFGYSYLDKQRDSSFLRYRYVDRSRRRLADIAYDRDPEQVFAEEHLGPDRLELRDNTLPTDNYTALIERSGYYVMADLDINQYLRVMFGARREDNLQRADTFNLFRPDQSVVGELEQGVTLPAVTATWSVNDAMQVRFGYSQTVNRPDLKELAQAPYIDPETRFTYVGNPQLQVADITNYDLRWEWYPGLDTVQVAVFHKEFENPIEQVIRLGLVGGLRTFANAETATNSGIELQLSKSLGFVGDRFADWSFDMNAALIESNVDIGAAGAQQTTNNRELQGQSPWVVNLQLGYDDPVRDVQFTLLYNIAGEYIFDVGVQSLPDSYQQSVGRLDLVYRHAFAFRNINGRFKLKVGNLLDPVSEITRANVVERSFTRGRTFSAGVDFDL